MFNSDKVRKKAVNLQLWIVESKLYLMIIIQGEVAHNGGRSGTYLGLDIVKEEAFGVFLPYLVWYK